MRVVCGFVDVDDFHDDKSGLSDKSTRTTLYSTRFCPVMARESSRGRERVGTAGDSDENYIINGKFDGHFVAFDRTTVALSYSDV